MKKAYLDSSAIIKLGHFEPESHALIDYLGHDHLTLATSIVADVEVRRTLNRLRSAGADPDEHVRGFFLLELSREVRDRAVDLGAGVLRSIDAIHVASALTIESDLDFITYDERQAAAARNAGLRVVQPGRTV